MFGILASYDLKDNVHLVIRWQVTILHSRAKERQYFCLLLLSLARLHPLSEKHALTMRTHESKIQVVFFMSLEFQDKCYKRD